MALLLVPRFALLRSLLLHCGCCTANPIGTTDGLAATQRPAPSGQYQMVGREVNTVPRWWLMPLLRWLLLLLLLRLYLVSS